ncbi:MAG: hypothetical protein EZS28_051923, partial [Streblomastix strix]
MAFGVAHGITGNGELHLVSVGHKLKEIARDNWICENTRLFSSKQFAGRGSKEFLLAQKENIISIQKSYETKLFHMKDNKITILNPWIFGIDPNKKAIA